MRSTPSWRVLCGRLRNCSGSYSLRTMMTRPRPHRYSYKTVVRQPIWAMYDGEDRLLATVRERHQLAAQLAFVTLPPWARGNRNPTKDNVRRLHGKAD